MPGCKESLDHTAIPILDFHGAGAEQKIADLKAQIEAHRDLSTSLAFD